MQSSAYSFVGKMYSRINVNVPLGNLEIKGLIKNIIQKRWQELCTQEGEGRHLYEIKMEEM